MLALERECKEPEEFGRLREMINKNYVIRQSLGLTPHTVSQERLISTNVLMHLTNQHSLVWVVA